VKRINSREKGAAGERELANWLKARGFEGAKRGQQFKGGAESPDVAGIPGVHIESKRTERGNLYDWLAQAQRDAGFEKMPVVFHRRNNKDWVVILDADDFIRCFNSILT
jgi:Holliday junction resolvase